MSKPPNALREFLSSGSGKTGTLFLLALVTISILVVATYPLDFGSKFWNSPVVWADNPKAVPPVWSSFLGSENKVEHRVFQSLEPSSISNSNGVTTHFYSYTYGYNSEEPPTFLSFTLQEVEYHRRPPVVSITVDRPDGRSVQLFRTVLSGPVLDEGDEPVIRFRDTPMRVYLSGEERAASSAAGFLRNEFSVSVPSAIILREGVEKVIFGIPNESGTFTALQGEYGLTLQATMDHPTDSIGKVKLVVGGSVFGVMGTDVLGRDLAVGLLFGFPVALFIGLVTATLTTLIGSFMGIFSGYAGGKTDLSIQRASDILLNVPLLPLLIFLTFIAGQRLSLVILILIVFSWPGLTIVVRSMVLQMKTNQFIEAAVAVGASRWRIMFRHVFPQTAPFIIAQMIFFVPSAILAEASLSFLGLGDPSLPTWGQILQSGFINGGVYTGQWWWVLPPGGLLVITAITFVFLALAMEPVINPKLRSMR